MLVARSQITAVSRRYGPTAVPTSVYLPSLLHTYLNVIAFSVTGVYRSLYGHTVWRLVGLLAVSLCDMKILLCGRPRRSDKTTSRVAYRSLTERHAINVFCHTDASQAH